MKKAPTKEELQLLVNDFPKFVDETRKNFSSVNGSLNTFEEKLNDIYKMLGRNGTETHLLAGSVNKATDKIEKHTEEVKEVGADLQKEIKGSTKVIIKEVDKVKKRWFQFWVKDKKEVTK